MCNTAPVLRETQHVGRRRLPHQVGPVVTRMEKRTDKRADPWGDFLRRLLLSAGIASTALPAAATEESSPVEVVEPEQPTPATAPAKPADG
jgi:hypothetical protein